MNEILSVWDTIHGDYLRGLGESGLMCVTEAGEAALPLAVAVLLVNVLCRRWLSAGQMGVLWCLVLARLLLPTVPASPVSLQNLMPGATPVPIQSMTTTCVDGRCGIDFDFNAPYANGSDPGTQPASGPILPHPTSMPIPGVDWEDFATAMIELIWLAAAVGILVWTLFIHWRFCLRVRGTSDCRDPRLLGLWDACCQASGVRNRLPIVVFDGVHQPAVMGLFRPELLLPPDALDLSDDELRMIMLHELAHVRRWDIAVNWGLVVLRALQWWNPIYWIAAARFRSLREQACDAFVVRAAQCHTSRDYSELLLKLAQQATGGSRWRVMVPASLLGLFESYFRKREIRLRLKALRSAGVRRSRWYQAAVGLFILLAALCGLTDAETPIVESQTANGWLPRGFDHFLLPSGDPLPFQGPLEERVYTISEMLRRSTPVELETAGGPRGLGWYVAGLLNRSRKTEEGTPAGKLPAPGEETPGGSYRWDGDRLIVNAPKSLHDEFATVLHAWETSGAAQIVVECRMLNSTRELATAMGIEWRSFGAESTTHGEPLSAPDGDRGTVVRASSRVEDHMPVFVVPLNDRQAKSITEAAQSDARTSLLFAPKITFFNGQEAMIVDYKSRPFVVGIDDNPEGTPKPRVETIDEGTKFKLRTVLSEDRKRIRLTGAIDLSSIEDVRSIGASTADGIRTIQVPRVRSSRIAVSSEVEDGQSLLIGCYPCFERKDFFYVLLTVKRLELTSED